MKRLGRQTWQFENRPRIIGQSAVVGPEEGEGPLSSDFDYVYDNLEIGEKTWEKGERKLLEQASQLALINANITKEALQFFVGGDLMNQLSKIPFQRENWVCLSWVSLEPVYFHGNVSVSVHDC